MAFQSDAFQNDAFQTGSASPCMHAQATAHIKALSNKHAQAQATTVTGYEAIIRSLYPTGWWRLSESSGSTAYAVIGPNGTYTGSWTYAQYAAMPKDDVYKSVQNNGTSSIYIDTNTSDLTNTFSIEIWIRPNKTITIATESNSGTGAGVSNTQNYAFYPSQKGGNRGLGLSVGTNGIQAIIHGDNTITPIASYSGTISTGWHHVIVTLNSKVPKIYLDGILVRTGITATATSVYAPIRLGGSADSYGPLNGWINNAVIYNTALSDSDITLLYSSGVPRAVAQAQAEISTGGITKKYAQAQAFIVKLQGVAQAQTRIKTSYQGYSQSQTNIKTISNGYAQAQANIIKLWKCAQAQGIIKGVVKASAQTQATIKGKDAKYAQAQAEINSPIKVKFAQARVYIYEVVRVSSFNVRTLADTASDINISSFAVRLLSDTTSDVKVSSLGIRALTDGASNVNVSSFAVRVLVNRSTSQSAQALVQILDAGLRLGPAQAQAKINAFGVNQFGQSQSRIAVRSWAFAQSMALIKKRTEVFAQAQALLRRNEGYAQVQAYLLQHTPMRITQEFLRVAYTVEPAVKETQEFLRVLYYPFSDIHLTQHFIRVVYNRWSQAPAQAMALIFHPQGFGQAQARLYGRGFGRAQVQAKISATSKKVAQAQTIIASRRLASAQARVVVRYQLQKTSLANALIRAPIQYAQAQAKIRELAIESVAQARVKVYQPEIQTGNAQARIKQVYTGYAQAITLVKTRFVFAHSQADIKQRYASFAQALTNIGQLSFGYGQAQVYITGIVFHRVAQAKTKVRYILPQSAQAVVDIMRTRRFYAQVQTLIVAKTFQSAQAMTSIRYRYVPVAQSQAQITRNKYGWAQAMARIAGHQHAQAQVLIKGKTVQTAQAVAFVRIHDGYLVKYNNYVLPGYAQSEDNENIARIVNYSPEYMDIIRQENQGLENKTLSLRMRILKENYREAKTEALKAATMIRSFRGAYRKLYMNRYDRYYLAVPESVKLEATTANTRTVDYTVQFRALPWVISDEVYVVSGTGNIDTGVRDFSQGTWTPAIITVTGTNITVSGYTDETSFTGYFAVSGYVSNLVVNSNEYTATINGVNSNKAMKNLDYAIYVGPGRTYFAVTGATTVELKWQNRW